MRLKVLPLLREIYPGCEQALCRFAEIAAEDDSALDGYVDQLGKELFKRFAGVVCINAQFNTALKRRAVRRVFADADYAAVTRALDAENRHRFCDLGNGYRAFSGEDSVYILPPLDKPEPAPVSCPGSTRLPGICVIDAEPCAPVPIRNNGFTQVLRQDTLSGTCVSLRQTAYVIRPLGMGGRTKSLGDYFTDRRYPPPLRERVPVIAAGSEIIWVPGVGISESARVRPGDKAARLSIKIEGADE